MKNSLKKWIKVKHYEVYHDGYMKCNNLDGNYILLEEIVSTSRNGEAVKIFPAGLKNILMERLEGKEDWFIFQASGYNEINGMWSYLVNADGTIVKTI